MPYDPELVARLRPIVMGIELAETEELTERKMFGGICFALNGKMLSGVEKDRVVVRVTDSDLQDGIEDGSLLPMDLTGKPMRNFAFLSGRNLESDEAILRRIQSSADYVREHMFGKGKKTESRSKAVRRK